jgi:hypothetical protein
MEPDWDATVACVLLSLTVVPLLVFYALTRPTGLSPLGIGLLAMLPGFLMGGAALWVAARG